MSTLPPPLPGQPRVQIDLHVPVTGEAALLAHLEGLVGDRLDPRLGDTPLGVERAYALACPADPEEAGLRSAFVTAVPKDHHRLGMRIVVDVADEEVLRDVTIGTAASLDEVAIAALVTRVTPQLPVFLRVADLSSQVLPGRSVDASLQRFGGDEAPDPPALASRLRRGDLGRGRSRVSTAALPDYTFEPVLVPLRSLRTNTPYYSWATAALEPTGARWRVFRYRRDGRITDCLAHEALVPPRRLQLEVSWFEEQFAREHPRALLLANAVRGGSRRTAYRVEVGRYEANERLALRFTDGRGATVMASLNVPCAQLTPNQAVVTWPSVPVLEAAGVARDTWQRISVGPKTFPIVEVAASGPPSFRAQSGEKAAVAELVASLGLAPSGREVER